VPIITSKHYQAFQANSLVNALVVALSLSSESHLTLNSQRITLGTATASRNPAQQPRSRSRGLRVTQGDASTLIRQDAQFDVISAFEVLEHLRSPGDLLRDARALLTPSGLLYLTTPNFNSLLRHLEGGNFSAICYPDHLCFFSPQSLRQLARKHGLKVARLRTTGLDPWRLKRAMLPRITRSSSSHSNDQDSGSLIGHASPPAGCRAALREATYSSRWGALAKGGVNTLVSLFGCGDTLKAWLVKK
jgi:hypothetical protein